MPRVSVKTFEFERGGKESMRKGKAAEAQEHSQATALDGRRPGRSYQADGREYVRRVLR